MVSDATRKSAVRKGSKAKTAKAQTKSPDAVTLLKADHESVEALFKRFETARTEPSKRDLVAKICKELTIHAQIEEEIFYPAVRDAIDDEDLMDEAEVEHQGAKDLIAQLKGGDIGDPLYEAKVTVLAEYIRHHVKEEQKEMFPKAKKADLDLHALGEQLQARKKALLKELA